MTDYEHDAEVGFELISTDDIDELGPKGIAERAKKRVGKLPVYISLVSFVCVGFRCFNRS